MFGSGGHIGDECRRVVCGSAEMIRKERAGEVFLAPEIIQKHFHQVRICAQEPYSWELQEVQQVESKGELEDLWKSCCTRSDQVTCCDSRTGLVDSRWWLTSKPAHEGCLRHSDFILWGRRDGKCFQFSYVHLKENGFTPVPAEDCACGWYKDTELENLTARTMAPLLSHQEDMANAEKYGARGFPFTQGHAAQAHIVLAASSMALRDSFPGKTILSVLSDECLHGFGMRSSPDLLLEVGTCPAEREVVYVEFFAQGKFNFRNEEMVFGEAAPYFPSKVFSAMLNASTMGCVDHVLTLWYSYPAQTLFYQCDTLQPCFLKFRKRLAQLWFPSDGLQRMRLYQEMVAEQLAFCKQTPCLVKPVQLDKDVCSNPFCRADVECMKKRHLFQLVHMKPCGHYGLGRCKYGSNCHKHHCRLLSNCNGMCMGFWQPTAQTPEWKPDICKGKTGKAKKVKAKAKAFPASELDMCSEMLGLSELIQRLLHG
ncbi:unnamed protein product [Symbiodinium sp. KB8]|nr:unnamed protein product [Symbiodinium sp. KB8]